eukprot:SAG25_NODE_74_length_16997_cov_287.503166_15_plen_51_part_01
MKLFALNRFTESTKAIHTHSIRDSIITRLRVHRIRGCENEVWVSSPISKAY